MKVAISTACFFPLDTERALAQLIQAGEHHIEIFINSFSELSGKFCRRLKEMTEENRITVAAIHPFTSNLEDMLFSPSVRRRKDMRELYKHYFQIAGELGAPYLILHGPNKMFHMSHAFYAEQFSALDEIARSMGVQVLQENIERCMSRDVDLLRYLCANVPQMGFTLDVKQSIRCGIPMEQMLQVLKGRIRHIHMSDHASGQDCLCPGRGTMNLSEFVSELKGIGYDGCLTIEIYGCREEACDELIAGAELLRSLL